MSTLDSVEKYASYQGLPPLAGLTSMARAVECKWSVEQSTERLKRMHYVLQANPGNRRPLNDG